eukprot:TRINITY_DN21388_c0_g1_i2.p1 TRINITY_DN21388_c0_g1~~TRINITY_DN21388_c0_g1_i2.p1  ORF type:complete len:315 (+),score=86.73 TRINITY_DN21388_c0_g1_i2:87-1031(+)
MPLSEKKRAYALRLRALIQEHKSVLVVHADNVGSKQMQQIRHTLRGSAEVLMGKNTTIRKVIKDFLAENEGHPIQNLVPYVAGNVGFVFTNSDLVSVRDVIMANKVPAPARVGSVAPVDVFVEPGPTGCDPGQTGWFQALNIPTKINKGQIEMISRVHLVKEGDKVGDSEAALLQKLDIRPFSYGLVVSDVYDNGEVFSAAVLDITEDAVLAKLSAGISAVAAVCLEIGFPTKASLPHTINNALKACVAIALGTDYSFPRATEFEEYLANPGAFAPAAAAGGAEAAAEVQKEEESEEESAGGAGGLFDDDEDDW